MDDGNFRNRISFAERSVPADVLRPAEEKPARFERAPAAEKHPEHDLDPLRTLPERYPPEEAPGR